MKHQERLIRVSARQIGHTLAEVLHRESSGQSMSDVRRWPSARRVLVDGNLETNGLRRLRGGEVIKILAKPQAIEPTEADVRIVHLDEAVVVVEKPAGMTSIRHPDERTRPGRSGRQPTLTDLLPRIISRVERSQRRRGPHGFVRAVHRLDRDTSGLMVFARTARAARDLARQFRAHSVERTYHAIVAGEMQAATITTYLARDRGDGRRGSTKVGEGKRAVTHVRPLERFEASTLVECRLETGRTHQIRIHLAERGHPVLGDKVYGGRTSQSQGSLGAPPRLALHAAVLGFVHPAMGAHLRFEMQLPTDLARYVARLRGKKSSTHRGGPRR